MSTRFQIVQSANTGPGVQPFIARWFYPGGREGWRTSENYARRAGAEKAILAFLKDVVGSLVSRDPVFQWNAQKTEAIVVSGSVILAFVSYVDAREG